MPAEDSAAIFRAGYRRAVDSLCAKGARRNGAGLPERRAGVPSATDSSVLRKWFLSRKLVQVCRYVEPESGHEVEFHLDPRNWRLVYEYDVTADEVGQANLEADCKAMVVSINSSVFNLFDTHGERISYLGSKGTYHPEGSFVYDPEAVSGALLERLCADDIARRNRPTRTFVGAH